MAKLDRIQWVDLALPAVALSTTLFTFLVFWVSCDLQTEGHVGAPLDDTYIYLQYARNFASGDLYAWIPDGSFTTGATSLLYVPLLALGYGLGFTDEQMVLYAIGLGAVMWWVALMVMGAWIRQTWALTEAICAVVVAGTSGMILWTMYAGMDGGLLLVATLLAIDVTWRWVQSLGTVAFAGWRAWSAPAVLAVLPWVRPEGAVFSILLAAWALYRALNRPQSLATPSAETDPKHGDKIPKLQLSVLLRLSAPLVSIVLLLSLYYLLTGSVRTNGVSLKSWMTDPLLQRPAQLEAVMSELWKFLQRVVIAPGSDDIGEASALQVLWVPSALVALFALRRSHSRLWLVGLLAIIGVGLSMQSAYANVHRHRYQAPFMAVLYALGSGGALHLLRRSIAHPQFKAALSTAAVGALLIFGWADTNAWSDTYAKDANDIRRHTIELGRQIGAMNLPKDDVIAVHDAGALPFFSAHPRFVDVVGLGSNGFARWYRCGPGSFFERLESLAPEDRPDWYAVYADWFEDTDIFGPVHKKLKISDRSIVPADVLYLFKGRLDALGSGDVLWSQQETNSEILDQLDLADLDSENAHNFDIEGPTRVTRYLRGARNGATVRADGARWLASPATFELMASSHAIESLVIRAARGAGQSLLVWVDSKQIETLTIGGGNQTIRGRSKPLLHEQIVALPQHKRGRLVVSLRPANGDLFVASVFAISKVKTAH